MRNAINIETVKTHIILGLPIKEALTYKVVEDTVTRRDSFTLEEFTSTTNRVEYYLGSEAIGSNTQPTTSPWVFKGEAPYAKSLQAKGLTLLGRGLGQVIGVNLEGTPWPDGVEVKPSAVDKAKKVLKELLPHYKGPLLIYVITEGG